MLLQTISTLDGSSNPCSTISRSWENSSIANNTGAVTIPYSYNSISLLTYANLTRQNIMKKISGNDIT
jgi:hypothetical protein